MTIPLVQAWTDGSVSPNPGNGGWGFVLLHPKSGKRIERLGGATDTTNNRMEMMAAIKVLEALNKPCEVRLHTDSQYLANGFARGWVNGWRRRDWKNAEGKEVANRDLWERLYVLDKKHNVAWLWVKGHAGNLNNERADDLAGQGRALIEGKIE